MDPVGVVAGHEEQGGRGVGSDPGPGDQGRGVPAQKCGHLLLGAVSLARQREDTGGQYPQRVHRGRHSSSVPVGGIGRLSGR